jgi:hypothetical protein
MYLNTCLCQGAQSTGFQLAAFRGLETVCQGPVISLSGENVGGCNGYNVQTLTGRGSTEAMETSGGVTDPDVPPNPQDICFPNEDEVPALT